MKKVTYTTIIRKFAKQGEKTGWTYIDVPADVTQQINPDYKRIYRVKGRIDNYSIRQTSIMPMGDGSFILPVNAAIRKGTGKRDGAKIRVTIEADRSEIKIDSDLITCLEDEPEAKIFFYNLSQSQRNYFSKWIESAKTEHTKSKRIAQAISALLRGMNFGEMLQSQKK